MELREWLIILGLVLVTIIVVDGVRRLQRQRKVPRLDRADDASDDAVTDPEKAARQAEINWELPNGGARVVRSATQPTVAPKPKLQRQDHPGPSKVFSRMAQEQEQGKTPGASAHSAHHGESQRTRAAEEPKRAHTEPSSAQAEPIRAEREEPIHERPARETPHAGETTQRRGEPASARTAHDAHEEALHDETEVSAQGRFSRSGMAAALRSGSQRVSQSMQRMSSAFQRQHEEEAAHPHREPSLGNGPDLTADDEHTASRHEVRDAAVAFEPPFEPVATDTVAEADHEPQDVDEPRLEDGAAYRDEPSDVVTPHPMVEKARRHHVSAQRARETLAHAEEVIVISVMARNDGGFSGTDLLNLMLACGLRYSEMGIFLRYETEDAESELQFAMVDVVKPGTFDLEAMDDFATSGVTFLMPLPGARDSAAAFEAMVETAMVLVRNLGGELKDENRSVMTAQTVEFARQRVQEFERRHRLHRYQAN